MIRKVEKIAKNSFKSKLMKLEACKEAIDGGLDVDKFFEQVLAAATDTGYEDLINGPIWKYIVATQKIGLGQVKLEYIYKQGEMYEYNQHKYVKPALDENGNIKQEIIDDYINDTFIEFKDLIAQRMEKYIKGGHSEEKYNFVEKNEYAKYFDNIERVFVDEETKNMVVMQVQVVTDVTDINTFIKYSPEFAIWNPKYFCKDEELNFLYDLKLGKETKKHNSSYPIPQKEFAEYMKNKKRYRHYVVAISERTIGYQQYFIEQLSKIKDKKILKDICEYKLDYGLVVINPLREQTTVIFEWHGRCYEFEVKKGELKPLNREVRSKKMVVGDKFKEEHAQWKKEHGVE
ncbi:hypothetical protein R2F61_03965 [Mollicutes bacterium LVI A0078]|nr:hypothetical protein RZE84_03985 [Mollicutes bacterium LVI A0075]WOO91719.1 hypothetical protein R2F61_03965 [Mollicutes bacterium LVI A0078]